MKCSSDGKMEPDRLLEARNVYVRKKKKLEKTLLETQVEMKEMRSSVMDLEISMICREKEKSC